MLGCLRGACQRVSYEVSLIFMVIFPFGVIGGLNLSYLNYYGYGVLVVGVFSLFVMWVVICICETNRSPFDFAEGERELVSGFNLEYGALQFALLYLGEYGMIVFLSYLSGRCFICGLFPVNVVSSLFIVLIYLWVRGTLPRFRYDLLMELA